MRYLIVLILAPLLSGCMLSRESSDRVEVERRRGIEAGQVVDVVTERQSQERTQTQTGVDPAALRALVSEAVKGAVPGLDAITGSVKALIPPPTDLAPLAAQVQALVGKPEAPKDHTEGIVGAGLSVAGLLAAYLKHREAQGHKADSSEGWAEYQKAQREALELAKQLPPPEKD